MNKKDLTDKYLLPFTVFVTGACVLVIEVVAVRFLSPHYGNTIYTVSSVISVILAALSLGYYFGGKYADKHPNLGSFFGIILLSGLSVLFFHFLSTLFLGSLSMRYSITTGPLISSLVFFFLPGFLLGTLSPYAIKLQSKITPKDGVGSISGKIFFWSTMGSILGSLSAGFVLIPNFGIDNILVSVGGVLVALGVLPFFFIKITKPKKLLHAVVAAVIFGGISILVSGYTPSSVVYSKDGIYEKVVVYDSKDQTGRPTRYFQQDRSTSGAMYLDTEDPTDLAYDYTKYYSLYKVFNPEIKEALVIGGGVYSIPKALLYELPDVHVDVSEIEPDLYQISKDYFNLQDSPRLTNYTEDGRRLLTDSKKKYDFIFSDVYYSLFSVPSHFTTQEFFQVAKDKLNNEGIFVANLIGDLSRQKPSLIMSEIRTFKGVFPNSYFIAVKDPSSTESQNIIFVGYNSDKEINFEDENILDNQNEIIANLHQKELNIDRYELSSYPILTDNYAPVETLTARVLRNTFNNKTTSLIDGKNMMAMIDQQLRYGPRYLSADGHKKVQDFIVAELSANVEDVQTQTWEHATSEGNSIELTNIVARLYPFLDRRIVIATHYDSKKHADKDKSNTESPVPGANDSASGVAVLLELAKAMNGPSHVLPGAGIDLIFFDGEEGDENIISDYSKWQPIGSNYFVDNITDFYPNDLPEQVIVVDMVCDKDLKIYKEESSYNSYPELVNGFWQTAQKVNHGAFENSVGQRINDDHTPFMEAGIPSLLLIDFSYPHFHTTEDTLDKCSTESLETVAQALYSYTTSLR